MAAAKRHGKDADGIVIKRGGRKRGHEVSHGAWKVAFADFTLAMMALFLVLWIAASTTPQQRQAMQDAINGIEPLEGSAGIFDGTSSKPVAVDSETHQPSSAGGGPPSAGGGASTDGRYTLTAESYADIETTIRSMATAAGMSENITLVATARGLRIAIHDSDRRSMFESGSSRVSESFVPLLASLAGILAKMDNRLMVFGHTDARPYRQGGRSTDNWVLSSQRALSVGGQLVQGGVSTNSILDVSGMAERAPLLLDAPNDGRNRRVELLVLTPKAAREWLHMMSGSGKASISDTRPGASLDALEQRLGASLEAQQHASGVSRAGGADLDELEQRLGASLEAQEHASGVSSGAPANKEDTVAAAKR